MGESPTKPILRLTVGHGRRGLWGWVWGWAGEIQSLRALLGLILRQLPPRCADSTVRVHTPRGLISKILPFSLPLHLPPGPRSDLSEGLGVIHVAAHFHSDLEVSGGPWSSWRSPLPGRQSEACGEQVWTLACYFSCLRQADRYIY